MQNPAVVVPTKPTPVEQPSPTMNLNLHVQGNLLNQSSGVERVAGPIIKVFGLILIIGTAYVLTAQSLVSTAIIEEVTRILFLCALGLIIEQGMGKKTKLAFKGYTFELE